MTQKIALVTGGTTGIGAAIAECLAKAGYVVGVTYYPGDARSADLPKWLDEERAKGFSFEAFPVDVADRSSVLALAAAVNEKLGPPLVLVNNAGITLDKMFAKMDLANFERVIQTNLLGLVYVTHAFLPGMVTAGWGRIVNMSSVNGQKGQAGQTNYSAAKAGMIGFAKALAQEVAAKGVTVNCVTPGYTATDMVTAIRPDILEGIVGTVPIKRLCAMEEIAQAVLFLVENGAATGSTVSVNGGLYMA
jgi:acetoacetyl-CoA reductase